MTRNIKVRADWKDEPDLGLFVQALIALVRQLQAQRAAEAEAGPESAASPAPGKREKPDG